MNKEKQKIIPELRFPEFENDGNWEEKTIDELGVTISGLRGKKGDDFGSGKPYVTYKQVFGSSYVIFKDCREVKVSESENQNEVRKGDILFTTSSETPHEVGFASVLIEEPEETTYLNSFCFALRPNSLKELLPNFSRFLFHSKMYREKVTLIAQGSTRFNLSKGAFIKLKLIIPNPEEQQKIANCLSSLDTVITAETEKLDYLKDHKKGLLQQLFPANGESKPQIRFPEFEGDGEWEEVILDEICTFSKGRGLPKSAIVEKGTLPCVHYGQLFTQYTEVIKTIKSFTNMKKGVLSEKNDVLMPTSDVTPKGLAKASCIKNENVVLGGDILIIRPDSQKVFGEFLSRYIRYLENEVLKLVSGSTVFHLYASSMKLLTLYLPSINEQQKIANCLSSLDDLIEVQTNKIASLKSHKKGLMQQLFPQSITN